MSGHPFPLGSRRCCSCDHARGRWGGRQPGRDSLRRAPGLHPDRTLPTRRHATRTRHRRPAHRCARARRDLHPRRLGHGRRLRDAVRHRAGLALNVTAVGATEQTNLRFFPAGGTVPGTANLNPTPGAPPTPNAVNVGLNDSGEFSVFNKFGSVAVVIDVVGYYDDHHHDDAYYTEAEIDAALALEADAADVYTQTEVDAIVDELETDLTTYYTVATGSDPIPAWTAGTPPRGTEMVMCQAGDIAVSGGFDGFMTNVFDSNLVFEESRPVETMTATGWQVTARNENPGNTGVFNLYVHCLDATP